MKAQDTKVMVGMSGGVDSSVAAWTLIEQGYEVTGLFMKNWDEDDGTDYCTAIADLEDAESVCNTLGIKLEVANFAAEYWDDVFKHFLSGYRSGQTPNPDVLCNREIKFKQFADYAQHLGADCIATGHYAIGRKGKTGFELHKAHDGNKDQTYFLQAVPQSRLANCLFPLGDKDKSQVREEAARLGFINHDKKDSTGICFIGERRFKDFLKQYVALNPGEIRDQSGKVRGAHDGLAYYTLGQREGLGIGGQKDSPELPWYVIDKNLETNELVVSQDTSLLNSNWLITEDINWLAQPAEFPLRCQAKVRYRQPDQECVVSLLANQGALENGQEKYTVEFAQPQRAVTPGQYVCFYSDTLCLGGGLITGYGV